MATGQHPFQGSTTAVVFDRILNQAPTAPVSLNAQFPAEFEQLLNKALEKDRDLRYQSAADLRADLKRLQRKSSGNVAALPAASAEPGAGGPVKPPTGRSASGTTPASGQSAPASVAGAGLQKKLRENRSGWRSCWRRWCCWPELGMRRGASGRCPGRLRTFQFPRSRIPAILRTFRFPLTGALSLK